MNVAMPHLRGKWLPTKAILRILEFSFYQAFLSFLRPALPIRQPSPTSGRRVSSLAEKRSTTASWYRARRRWGWTPWWAGGVGSGNGTGGGSAASDRRK